MPIVKVDIVPELIHGDGDEQYGNIAAGITDAIVTSTGAPADSVHVLINEVSHPMYSVGGIMLRERVRSESPR